MDTFALIPWEKIGAGAGWPLVAYFVWLFYKGKIVPRDTLVDVIKERDDWKEFAMRSIGVTERMTKPVEVVADVMTRLPDPSKISGGDS